MPGLLIELALGLAKGKTLARDRMTQPRASFQTAVGSHPTTDLEKYYSPSCLNQCGVAAENIVTVLIAVHRHVHDCGIVISNRVV